MVSINIPNSVTSIGEYAFSDCSGLTSISIPNSVKSIGEYAFSGCESLISFDIPNNIKIIENGTFSYCSNLTSIVIPNAVDSIGDYVFRGCTALAYFTISYREAELKLGSNGSEPLFADCPLDTVYIGGNISYPTSSSDGYSPFYRNTSLQTVRITDKETEISGNEFYGCTGLKNVTLGNGIEHIGEYAFSGCSSLDNFTFGTHVQDIGEEAFSDCTAMTRLVSNTVVPPVCGAQALDDINKWTCQLFVPEGSVASYQQADQWKDFFFMGTVGIDENIVDGQKDKLARILAGPLQVYSTSGALLRQLDSAASADEALSGLERGIYILRGNGASCKVCRE